MYNVFPLSPLFTLACAGMVFLVWNRTPMLEHLDRPWLLFFGAGLVVVGGILATFKRKLFPLSYDLFCLGSLGVWFVHWREVYRPDAPVFVWYPIFFVFLVLLLNRQVIDRSRHLDPIQMKMVELILSFAPFHPVLLTTGVLLSVYFSEFYIFYPIALSFVLIRCSFAIVLQESAQK